MTGLEELRARKVELIEDLARGGVGGVLAVEREIRAALRDVPEHVADDPLTEEEVRRWVGSVHWQFARTMAQNPHEYANIRWCDEGMFRRVCVWLWDRSYPNVFGGREFPQCDLAGYTFWTCQARGPSGRDPSLTTILNRKPLSIHTPNPPRSTWRPTKSLIARAAVRRLGVGEGLTLSGAEVAVERVEEDRFCWVRGARSSEVDREEAVRKLAARKARELDGLSFNVASPTQPALPEPDEKEHA